MRVGILLLATVTLFVGCNDDKKPTAAPPGAPALPAELPKLDLCGTEQDTVKYLKRLQDNGGAPNVLAELKKGMKAPVELTVCSPLAGPKVLRSTYVYLQQLGQGQPQMLQQWGDETQTTGTRSWRVNAFVGNTPSGVRIGANYIP